MAKQQVQKSSPSGVTSSESSVPLWLAPAPGSGLSDTQEKQLDAIFGRILPGDEAHGVPSAIAAGASRFVSLLLGRDVSVYFEIADWKLLYPVWLQSLEDYTQRKHGRLLVEVSPEQMDAIIGGLEAGSLVGLNPPIEQKLAFKTFLRHCIQGCFADPRWGGNRDRVMWRWIGYLQQAEDLT